MSGMLFAVAILGLLGHPAAAYFVLLAAVVYAMAGRHQQDRRLAAARRDAVARQRLQAPAPLALETPSDEEQYEARVLIRERDPALAMLLDERMPLEWQPAPPEPPMPAEVKRVIHGLTLDPPDEPEYAEVFEGSSTVPEKILTRPGREQVIETLKAAFAERDARVEAMVVGLPKAASGSIQVTGAQADRLKRDMLEMDLLADEIKRLRESQRPAGIFDDRELSKEVLEAQHRLNAVMKAINAGLQARTAVFEDCSKQRQRHGARMGDAEEIERLRREVQILSDLAALATGAEKVTLEAMAELEKPRKALRV